MIPSVKLQITKFDGIQFYQATVRAHGVNKYEVSWSNLNHLKRNIFFFAASSFRTKLASKQESFKIQWFGGKVFADYFDPKQTNDNMNFHSSLGYELNTAFIDLSTFIINFVFRLQIQLKIWKITYFRFSVYFPSSPWFTHKMVAIQTLPLDLLPSTPSVHVPAPRWKQDSKW